MNNFNGQSQFLLSVAIA